MLPNVLARSSHVPARGLCIARASWRVLASLEWCSAQPGIAVTNVFSLSLSLPPLPLSLSLSLSPPLPLSLYLFICWFKTALVWALFWDRTEVRGSQSLGPDLFRSIVIQNESLIQSDIKTYKLCSPTLATSNFSMVSKEGPYKRCFEAAYIMLYMKCMLCMHVCMW